MSAIPATSAHGCVPNQNLQSDQDSPLEPSLLTRIANAVNDIIRELSRWLYNKSVEYGEGFVGTFFLYTHFTVGSLFSEPLATLSCSVNRLVYSWQTEWEKHGFYDAGSTESMQKLEEKLNAEASADPAAVVKPPLILLHAFLDTPHNWLYWAPELEKAEAEKKIGHAITLQLPDAMEEQLPLVRKTIETITALYAKVFKKEDQQVDLWGHSRGGYTAHLAAFANVTLKDKEDVERRWHTEERNPLVRKVVTLAAPGWLCCDGQKEGDHNDRYPRQDYTAEQLKTIAECHANVYDIIGTQDAISFEKSGLPAAQVFAVDHKHLGIVHCPDVCQLALSLL
jgi:pimeloyl-ACP methyl ester carboxylesterase